MKIGGSHNRLLLFFGIIEGKKGNVVRLWDNVRGRTGKRFEDSE